MNSIRDWATLAAERIDNEFETAKHRPSIDRIAAIIVTHAERLLVDVRMTRREHFHREVDGLVFCCPKAYVFAKDDAVCCCGADEWNEKLDAALSGSTQRSSTSASGSPKKRRKR